MENNTYDSAGNNDPSSQQFDYRRWLHYHHWVIAAFAAVFGIMLLSADNFPTSASAAELNTTYSVPGTYTFTVPSSFSTLTVEVWGAGGGGGEDNGKSGQNGSASIFSSATPLLAQGGVGGDPNSSGGAGGFASGGMTNTFGSAGETATKSYSGAGGASANGGRGGGRITMRGPGLSGTVPGGGGSGSYGRGSSVHAGGGGGGGYVSRTFSPSELAGGSAIVVIVGTGGAGGGSGSGSGGSGAAGAVKITWIESPPPPQASTPNPASGATGSPLSLTLSWTGSSTTNYDVYFGTTPVLGAPDFKSTQAGTSYGVSGLTASTTYYWRIDSKNDSGTTAGPVWSFTTEAPAPASAPDLSFCANTVVTSAGTLCAIKPSSIDSRTKDVYSTSGTSDDLHLGFGYHVLAVPSNWSAAKGVWVHFTGSYGRPYNQDNRSYESITWLNELMQEGYAVIQLAYDNRYSVNLDLCGRNNAGYNRDNCAGEVREETQTGVDVSPYRDTDSYNSIDYRLQSLIAYLQNVRGIMLPGGISSTAIDWSKLRVSGHSQGANQSYYIARQHGVAYDCIIAGGYDTADSINPNRDRIADWFVVGTSVTPISRIGAIIAEADTSYTAFSNGLQLIGLTPTSGITTITQTSFVDQNGNPVDAHEGTLKDPSLALLRAEACFR